LERYLPVNLLGPGPRLIKKNLPGRGLTKVEKHWFRWRQLSERTILGIKKNVGEEGIQRGRGKKVGEEEKNEEDMKKNRSDGYTEENRIKLLIFF